MWGWVGVEGGGGGGGVLIKVRVVQAIVEAKGHWVVEEVVWSERGDEEKILD